MAQTNTLHASNHWESGTTQEVHGTQSPTQEHREIPVFCVSAEPVSIPAEREATWQKQNEIEPGPIAVRAIRGIAADACLTASGHHAHRHHVRRVAAGIPVAFRKR